MAHHAYPLGPIDGLFRSKLFFQAEASGKQFEGLHFALKLFETLGDDRLNRLLAILGALDEPTQKLDVPVPVVNDAFARKGPRTSPSCANARQYQVPSGRGGSTDQVAKFQLGATFSTERTSVVSSESE